MDVIFLKEKKLVNSKNCKSGKVHIVLQAGLKNNDGVLDFKSFHLLYIYQFSIHHVENNYISMYIMEIIEGTTIHLQN